MKHSFFAVTSIFLFSSNLWAGYQGCTSNQQQILETLQVELNTQIQSILTDIPKFDLKYVNTTFLMPDLRPSNNTSDQKYVRYQRGLYDVFRKMGIESNRGINFSCKDSNYESQCKNGEVIAYVLFLGATPLKTLYLCSGFFNSSHQEQLQTTQHELSHYAASTDDLALSWLNYKNPNLDLAFTDAYHIEGFEKNDTEHFLKRQIWYWNWPKAPLDK